jgi:hypothetical protein
MEFLGILRALKGAGILVAIGALLAIAIAVSAGRAKPGHSGLAWTRVVLDTPKSELVSPAPAGAESLEWRAALLASLMTTNELKQTIARSAGIPADSLATIDPDLTDPAVPASLPTRASNAAAVVSETHVLTARTQALPIIKIDAAAPDRAGAIRLADAAVRALQAQTTPFSTRETQGLLVERAAPTRSKDVVSGHGPVLALAMAVFFFAFWCGCVLLVSPLLRALRAHGWIPTWASRKIPAMRSVEFGTRSKESEHE